VTWYALAAPPQTPAAIVNKINAAVNEALRDPKVDKGFTNLSAEPAGSTPAATAAYFHDEVERWKKVIVAAHVTLD
jgi:tripartite-type tricarboxylate transporter receptor subunit TctC